MGREEMISSEHLCRRARIEELNLTCIILAYGTSKEDIAIEKTKVCIIGEKTHHKTTSETPEQLWNEYSRMVLNIIKYSTIQSLTKESFLSTLELYPFNTIAWTEVKDITFPSKRDIILEDLDKVYV